MMLIIDAVVDGVDCPAYTLWVDDLCQAYEVLLDLDTQNWTLCQVFLHDHKGRLDLTSPDLQASALNHTLAMEQLRRQWQQALHGPDTPHEDISQRRIRLLQKEIDHLHTVIANARQLLNADRLLGHESHKQRVTRRLEANLRFFEGQLSRRQTSLAHLEQRQLQDR